jgi:hypothetical protein
VDANRSARYCKAFEHSGITDFMVITFANADRLLFAQHAAAALGRYFRRRGKGHGKEQASCLRRAGCRRDAGAEKV